MKIYEFICLQQMTCTTIDHPKKLQFTLTKENARNKFAGFSLDLR